MLNSVVLIGRLTKDPELRYTQSGQAVATFTLAVDRGYQNQQGQKETDFINIVTWSKQAENVANYMKKGRLVAVEGRIQTRNYENNEGKKVYVTEVVAENVKFLESAKERGGDASLPPEPSNYSSRPPSNPTPPQQNSGSSLLKNSNTVNLSDHFSDDDLPFDN